MNNGDRRGNMPFAVIAVTILMMTVMCGAVFASYDRASQDAEDLERESESIEVSRDGIAIHVDRGLGEIILSISNDTSLGGLDDRADAFGTRAEEWLGVPVPGERPRGACGTGLP